MQKLQKTKKTAFKHSEIIKAQYRTIARKKRI